MSSRASHVSFTIPGASALSSATFSGAANSTGGGGSSNWFDLKRLTCPHQKSGMGSVRMVGYVPATRTPTSTGTGGTAGGGSPSAGGGGGRTPGPITSCVPTRRSSAVA
jgi:hypothetical protein